MHVHARASARGDYADPDYHKYQADCRSRPISVAGVQNVKYFDEAIGVHPGPSSPCSTQSSV
jgi:hypothetical protein